MTEKINHSENVGTVRDMGVIDKLPTRAYNGAGHPRAANPFDEGVAQSYRDGKPRLAYADDLKSAKVLIRRAAEHRGIGVTVVPTLADDGTTPILAYQAHDKLKGRGPGNKGAGTDSGDTADTSTVPATPATADTSTAKRKR